MSSRDMSNNENGHDASLVVASVCIIPAHLGQLVFLLLSLWATSAHFLPV